MKDLFASKKKSKKGRVCRQAGFTIIEVLVLLFIFVVIITTFFRFFLAGTSLILDAKKKLVAISIANERIEVIRSLPYGEIGTVSGVPSGEINSSESVSRGGYGYNLLTSIVYQDDAFDGTDDDPDRNDYKKITATVKWGSESPSQVVSVSTIVAPFGEEVGIGGGILNVSVIDIKGNPVPDVTVNIANPSISYNQNATTNSSGGVTLVGLTPSNQNYVITLSKTGYENDVLTLPPYPTSAFYPVNVHASVISASTTKSVFSFSSLSDFKIRFTNPFDGSIVPDVDFSLEGGRVIGANTDSSLVHNYLENSLSADSSGEMDIVDASPGQYTVAINDPGYLFWRTDSGSGNNADEILVEQGETGQIKNVYLLDKLLDSYFIKVTDSITGSPLEGVSVEVSSSTLGFTDTDVTDEYGYVFIAGDAGNPLVSGETYDVHIPRTGYGDADGTVAINQLTQGELSLDPL